MIHRTYRRLDEPGKIGPFSLSQWVVLILIGAATYAFAQFINLGMQPTMVIIILFVGTPGVLMYVSEGSRPSYLRVMRATLVWTFSAKSHVGGYGKVKPFTIHADTDRKADAADTPDHVDGLELMEEAA